MTRHSTHTVSPLQSLNLVNLCLVPSCRLWSHVLLQLHSYFICLFVFFHACHFSPVCLYFPLVSQTLHMQKFWILNRAAIFLSPSHSSPHCSAVAHAELRHFENLQLFPAGCNPWFFLTVTKEVTCAVRQLKITHPYLLHRHVSYQLKGNFALQSTCRGNWTIARCTCCWETLLTTVLFLSLLFSLSVWTFVSQCFLFEL